MNIADPEAPSEITAKTCGYRKNRRKVTYSFVDTYHNLCKDKKDIITSEILACEILRNHTRDEFDLKAIETEIAELKMILDLLP